MFYNLIENLIFLGVGKSCLLLQFTDKRFQPVHDLTIGKLTYQKTIHIRVHIYMITLCHVYREWHTSVFSYS